MLKASLSIVLALLNVTLIAAGQPSGPISTQAVTTPKSQKAPLGTTSIDTTAETDAANDGHRVLADVNPNDPIRPRVPQIKTPIRGPGSLASMLSPTTQRTGNVIFKLRDGLKARTGLNPGTALHSAATTSGAAGLVPSVGAEHELDEVRRMLGLYGASIHQSIRIPANQLAAMELKARNISRIEQPDLAGIIAAVPAAEGMQIELAEALNTLACVEYVHIEYIPVPAQSDQCTKDVSLQLGPGNSGGDVVSGTDCTTYTDTAGNTQFCLAPPPVFIHWVFNAGTGLWTYRPAAAPAGVIPCQAPDRWYGFQTAVLQSFGCGTANATYSNNIFSQPNLFDCTPFCNAGGSANGLGGGLCSNPPTGFTTVQGCQYGCQDNVCAGVVVGQGFSMCTDPNNQNGWDALCATIANIYCSSGGGANPYAGPGPFEPYGNGGWLADPASSNCYGLVQDQLVPTTGAGPFNYSFGSGQIFTFDGDAQVYDSCFAMRGPANPPLIDPALAAVFATSTIGILAYTDVGDGSGLRPWGFRFNPVGPFVAGNRVYSNAFLDTAALGYPSGTFTPNAAPCALVANFSDGGEILWNEDPNDPLNAADSEFNFALKSYPFTFSHDCFTIDPITPGCYQTQCCVFVCSQDPSCCNVAWDSQCFGLANGNVLCRTGALNSVDFPTAVTDGTPNFLAQQVSVGRSRGLQMWATSNTVVNSCSEYVRLNPSVTAGQIPLNTIDGQSAPSPNPLDNTQAFINSGFSGGGIGVDQMVSHVTAAYPSVSPSVIRGAGLTVGVIDYSAFIDHEALVGKVTVEPGQTIILTPTTSTTFINPDHGTAVLGILVGQQVAGLGAGGQGGILGLLSEANAIFFPGISLQEGGRIPTAIARAGQILQPGDLLCMPLSFQGNYSTSFSPTLSATQQLNDLLSVVRSLGITAVQPAGNGGFQSILSPNGGETYCITVGGCWPGYQVPQSNGATGFLNCPGNTFPGIQYCRYRTSNWTATQGPNVANIYGIDVAGWGTGICTLGLGTLWNGQNPASTSTDYSNPALTADRLRSYQLSFDGTSGSAAMITGMVGAMQGFANGFFGSPISPTRVRQILANQRVDQSGNITNLDSVVLQCGGTPGTLLPTTDTDVAIVVKNGDILSKIGTQHNIGGFPKPTVCIDNVTDTTFNSAGTPFDISVIKGTIRSGNKFSCARLDNGFLKIQGVRSSRGSTGQGYGSTFPYAANGLVADVQLRAITRLVLDSEFNNMSIAAYGAATSANQNPNIPQNTALSMIYVYNRKAKRWRYLTFNFLTNQVPTVGLSPLTSNLALTYEPVTNFLVTEGSQKVVYFRVVTYGFGIIGPFQVWWDLFDIGTNPTLPI